MTVPDESVSPSPPSPQTPPRRASRWRRVAQVLGVPLVLLLAWGAFTLVRTSRLQAISNDLALKSQFKAEYFVGPTRGKPLTYLALGDSTVVGVGAGRLEATYPYLVAQSLAARGFRVHVMNFAQSGARLSDVCLKQLVFLNTTKPDFVTVGVGANDATHGTSYDEFTENLRVMLASLQSSEARLVLIGNTPDMYQVPALPLPLALRTGNTARRLNFILNGSSLGANVKIVDVFDQGRLIYAENPGLYAADLFHPSAQGYARWAKLYSEKAQSLK